MEVFEAVRVEKLRQIDALGCDPYPGRYSYTFTLRTVLDRFLSKSAEEIERDTTKVRIAGRILANRPFGKAGFMALSDGEGRLQVYVRRDALPERDFKLYGLLDIGDLIGVEGTLFRTRTGELTVLASELTFLAKSFVSLPEKWHGLVDVETRYRRRYLDLIVNPDVREVFVKRGRIVRELRRFLDDRGYLEVETPILHPIAGGALARPFKTHHRALDMALYLRIAPELYLKRLIVGGINRVYDLNRSFRNEGISIRHNPEYTMLEFYQAYSDYNDLMDLTEEMFTGLVDTVCGSRVVRSNGQEIDFNRWSRMSMRQAIVRYFPDRIDESALSERTLVERLLHQVEVSFDSRSSLGQLIGILFEHVVEDHLVQPTFIYDYPIELSPLSKVKERDPTLAERFELYIGTMEVANGYSELNDPVEQRRRFEAQLVLREQGDEEAHVMDEDYLRALSYGMPPTAGEGIGVDRLTMVLTDSKSIRDVILFPHHRPE